MNTPPPSPLPPPLRIKFISLNHLPTAIFIDHRSKKGVLAYNSAHGYHDAPKGSILSPAIAGNVEELRPLLPVAWKRRKIKVIGQEKSPKLPATMYEVNRIEGWREKIASKEN